MHLMVIRDNQSGEEEVTIAPSTSKRELIRQRRGWKKGGSLVIHTVTREAGTILEALSLDRTENMPGRDLENLVAWAFQAGRDYEAMNGLRKDEHE